MAFQYLLANIFQKRFRKLEKDKKNAILHQERIRKYLVRKAENTLFGRTFFFKDIQSYQDFKEAFPVTDYEPIRPYTERMLQGEKDILWPGKPLYFATTSGTTGGTKYIPITKASIYHHINGARNALVAYAVGRKKYKWLQGRMIFLSGSPLLSKEGKILTGRLSGIVNHHIPFYFKYRQKPTFQTNVIEDWETKLKAIVCETVTENMTLIGGIPPWVLMYFEYLLAYTGKKNIREVFPDFQALVHGGVNFAPYKSRMETLMGGAFDYIETFPASEGFIAFQDRPDMEGLLLNTNAGIFFEFLKLSEIGMERPPRYRLSEVSTGENYVLVLNTNAGLWGYNLGDTVRFVSLNPYRIVVTGRVKHYISAFGEHVIAEEVEAAMERASKELNFSITDFTVSPLVCGKGNSCHEWYVEFPDDVPQSLYALECLLDTYLREKNKYYDDLIAGKILRPLRIKVVPKNGFVRYMKSIGKLGGQNKVPRLTNDRKLADALENFL